METNTLSFRTRRGQPRKMATAITSQGISARKVSFQIVRDSRASSSVSATHFRAINNKTSKILQESSLEHTVRGTVPQCPVLSKPQCVRGNKESKMTPTQTKPSFVFCHGLWADGSCFSKLIFPLQAEGYE